MQPLRVIDWVVSDGRLAFFVGRARDVEDVHEHVRMAQVIKKFIAQAGPLKSQTRGKEEWTEGMRKYLGMRFFSYTQGRLRDFK